MSDAVNKPAHYNQGSIECIEAMKIVLTPEEFRGYLKGNVFKYLWREKDKNGNEDLRKGKSYYDRLIELVDEYEQQKAADLQSLKDHPFGKLKKPKWTPKVGDWVRIKKPADTQASATSWWPEMNRYDGQIIQVKQIEEDGVVLEEWGFMFDWLEPAEQPVVKESLTTKPDPGEGYRLLSKNPPEKLLDTDEGLFACGFDGKQWLSVNYSEGEQLPSVYYRRKIEPAEQPKATGHFDDTEGVWVDEKSPFDGRRSSDKIPEGYRKLGDSSIEPRQLGDLRWSVAEKRYIEISVDEIGYANRDNWAACRKVEPVIKQPLNTEPPDGWRWLEVGEVICKGDKNRDLKSQAWIECIAAVGDSLQGFHKPTIRRNRFEVGEKVVRVFSECVYEITAILDRGCYEMQTPSGYKIRLYAKDLAPYIEEAK